MMALSTTKQLVCNSCHPDRSEAKWRDLVFRQRCIQMQPLTYADNFPPKATLPIPKSLPSGVRYAPAESVPSPLTTRLSRKEFAGI